MANHSSGSFSFRITVVLAVLAVSVVISGLLGLNAAGNMLDALGSSSGAASSKDAVEAAPALGRARDVGERRRFDDPTARIADEQIGLLQQAPVGHGIKIDEDAISRN